MGRVLTRSVEESRDTAAVAAELVEDSDQMQSLRCDDVRGVLVRQGAAAAAAAAGCCRSTWHDADDDDDTTNVLHHICNQTTSTLQTVTQTCSAVNNSTRGICTAACFPS